ncbi:MAG TPA: GWxTD domain-containing protein [Ignavibacteriales bacterium]|nr:GWxTD domain-containing protein [Ignavibacteriales bacterium]HOM65378.1 GWxTD domain-containing protein [Ignavibacteriales bacterium]HPD67007.1 GWxTD domain-containing protein [Ignavibacteriales bacterium]HPP33593.1 GWxTD domain-containing protein [Ignavibacteriales bacterium]HRR18833.1 GWxTD domain-containing protein [Ignavibacteriales bacterium]
MKTFIKIILVSFLFISNSFSQTKDAYNDNLSNPKFFYDVFNYYYDGQKNRLELFVSMPYNQVRFVKKNNIFEAKYRIDFTVYDEKKSNVIQEKSWYETIKVNDFNTSINPQNFMLSNKTLYLRPGNYIFVCNIEDQETKKNLLYEDVYTVRNLNNHLALSDVMFIRKLDNNRILPNISRNIISNQNLVNFYYELYSDTNTNVVVNYSIFKFDKKTDELMLNYQENIELKKGNNQIVKELKFKELSLGTYRLELDVEDVSRKIKLSTYKVFTSFWYGMPENIKDLNKAIEQMIYIAPRGVIDEIQSAKTEDEKKKIFADFWRKLDPTPGTEENEIFNIYYQRVAFANANFSTYREGWRTDFGMVYILLGPPDNIERHPFEFDTKPYEVWSYYRYNYTFYFVDESGFGEYRLVYPSYGDWTKFRP